MKSIRIEIQTALLALVMIVSVVVSGYYFFSSLAGMVDVVHRQAQSDPVLEEIRNISSDLPEVENMARLYILSGDGTHLFDYRQMNDSIVAKLLYIDQKSESSFFAGHILDSISTLVLRRLIIWNEILDIHLSATNSEILIPELTKPIVPITADTIMTEVARKGFLARLFRKKRTEPEPIVLPVKDTIDIRKELEKLQLTIRKNAALMKNREAELVEANQDVTSRMYNLIWQLETLEQRRLEANTIEAGILASAARKHIAFFGVFMVVLIILLISLVFRFIRKNSQWQSSLIESKRQTEELSRTKETFINHVSHEMRTPVNAIFGVTEQVLQHEMDESMRMDLIVVRNSAHHLLNLVNNTLDLARINAGLLSINFADYCPDTIMKEVIELLKPAAIAKNIKLIYEPGIDLPSALKGDPVRLKQMIINLLSNAIKFTEKGFVRLEVITIRKNDEIWLNVKVTDTGTGIAESDLPRVFDEFMQAESNDPEKHIGTGLGLSIVKRLAELQNGRVSITSQPGTGTVVSFNIPCIPGNPNSIIPATGSNVIMLEPLQNLRILIVDDEPYNRHLLSIILQKWRILYDEATNGQEAVSMALNNNYDGILMDIRMPVKDGLTASKEIVKVKPEAIIIALTATASSKEVDSFNESGIRAYITKPFTEVQLVQIFNQFFGGKTISVELVNPIIEEIEEVPELDINELYRISNGNKEFYLELFHIFINSTERGLKKIREAFDIRDFEELSNLAHKMASPVKHIQANRVYKIIKELENLDFEKVHESAILELLDTIESEIQTINKYLRKVYDIEKRNLLANVTA